MVPSVSLSAYHAARHHTAYQDRSADRGRLVVRGGDRGSYLHGLLTNDISALTPGAGCYAAYLTPQGRMISDMFCYELGDLILMMMGGTAKATVLEKLDQFIFNEDVTLGDVTDTFAQIAVVGPEADRTLAGVLGDDHTGPWSSLAEHGNRRVNFRGHSSIVTQVSDVGVLGFDVYIDRQHLDAFTSALTAAGLPMLDRATGDALRIEAGVPQFHRDMDEDTIPLEAGIESRAISFSKGCYVGQEVIIRVLHRGHGRIARKLVGVILEGAEVPTPGSAVRSKGVDVGHVTSSTASPALGKPIALAYLRREFIEPGTVVAIGGVEAVVTALPFV